MSGPPREGPQKNHLGLPTAATQDASDAESNASDIPVLPLGRAPIAVKNTFIHFDDGAVTPENAAGKRKMQRMKTVPANFYGYPQDLREALGVSPGPNRAKPVQEPEIASEPTTAPSGSKAKLDLIWCDEVSFREMGLARKKELEAAGFRVHTFKSSEKCVRSLEKRIAGKHQRQKELFAARGIALISKRNLTLVPFIVANAESLQLIAFLVFLPPGQAGQAKKVEQSFQNIDYFGGVVSGWPETLATLEDLVQKDLSKQSVAPSRVKLKLAELIPAAHSGSASSGLNPVGAIAGSPSPTQVSFSASHASLDESMFAPMLDANLIQEMHATIQRLNTADLI